jgi:hypothetical protein
LNFSLSPEQADFLSGRAARIAASAHWLGEFGETDPDLAGACGVEVCALEARTLLGSGLVQRVQAAAEEALRYRRPVLLAGDDLEGLARLEAAVALGSSRIGIRLAAMEAEAGQEGLSKFGGLLGLAGSVWGLMKSIL